jgi:hypothetical protein
VGFVANNSIVAENVGNASVEVRLSAAYHKPVSVAFATSPGSARPRLDYQSVAGTLTFAPGVTSAFITVPILDDTRDEAPESFTIELSAAQNAVLITNRHTLSITDNDAARVRMPDVSVIEGDSGTSNAIVTITFDVPLGEAIELEYRTEPGTAQNADYIAVSGKLNVAAGTSSTSFIVPIVGDTIDEPDQTVKLVLKSLTPDRAQVLNSEATLTIRDNDNPPVLSVSSSPAVEGSTLVFVARLSKTSELPIRVEWKTEDGTALANSDYDAANGTLAFAPGTLETSFSVLTKSDTVNEGSEYFRVRFSNAQYLTTPPTFDGWIIDDDKGIIFVNDIWLYEGDPGTPSTAIFTVQMTPKSDLEVSVNYVTRDRSAQASVDYQTQSGTLVFAPGETSKTIAVPILGDYVVEPSESFELFLSRLSTDAVSLLRDVAVATILNDDNAAVEIAPTAFTLAEGESAVYTVQLTSEPVEPVTIELAPDARLSLSDTAVTFDNTNWDAPQTVTVTAVDDDIFYGTSSFTILHTINTIDDAYKSYSVASVSVMVDDNDEVGLNLTPSNILLNEGQSKTYQLSLRSQPLAPVTITLTSDSQLSFAPMELVFLTNTWSLSQTITVTATDDILVEGVHIGRIDHTLTSGDSFYNGSSPVDFEQFIVAIGDNDAAVLSIDSVSMDEGNTGTSDLIFTVTLTKPHTLPVTVDYTTQDASALAGSDYLPVSGTLNFAPLQTTQTITVSVLGDTRYENNETFQLVLDNAINATISDTIGIGTILNDDPQPTITFSATSQTLSENVGLASFSLLVSEASGLPITVTLSLTGTAEADDYTLTAGQIVIPPDTISATVPFTIVDDLIDELDETLILTLSAPQNAALGAIETQTITIVDDDEYSVRFSQGQYTVGEADGTATIYVTLESALPYTVTVDYAAVVSAEGTASTADFTPTVGVLTFDPGATRASFPVAIKNDTLKESYNKTVALRLNNTKGATIGAPNPAMLTIVDDDTPVPGEADGLNFYMTGGKNRTDGDDTWYARNGSYDFFEIVIPCGWPSSEPVYIDLFAPGVGNVARDRIIGVEDVTRFSLYAGLSGSDLIAQTDFAANTYTNSWVRFATINPASCGVYQLRSETLDNDSNGWSLRVGRDNDSDPANTPPANYRNFDGLAATGDEIIIGLTQVTVQLRNTDAATCTTLYEYVAPGQASVFFHNYDMDWAASGYDATARVHYYPPGAVYDPNGQATVGSIAGTVGGSGWWNNATEQYKRGTGDKIDNPVSGWWRIVTCAERNNQYIQEGQQGVPAYLSQPPTPVIAASLNAGESTIARGELRTVTLEMTNIASGSSAGAAQNLVVTVDLPSGLSFEGTLCAMCSLTGQRLTIDFGAQTIPATATSQLTFQVRIAADATGTQRITSSASYTDVYGNFYQHSSGAGILRIQ